MSLAFPGVLGHKRRQPSCKGKIVKQKAHQGFTLIEVMIVVAIVAILTAVAVPNYTRYVERGRRAEARELMMRVASAEERYYTNFNRYTANISAAAPTGLGLANLRSEHYTVAVVLGATNQEYTIMATAPATFPAGHPDAGKPNPQARDKCGVLSLSNAGVKNQTGSPVNGACW